MRPLVTLLLLALPVLAAPVPKGLKKVSPKPDGAWKLVEFDADGKGGQASGMVRDWFIEGEHIFVGAKVEPAHGAKGPPNFTFMDPDRPNMRKWGTMPAIYELDADGDTLRCGYAHDGRKELTECKPQMGVHFYVFKRAK